MTDAEILDAIRKAQREFDATPVDHSVGHSGLAATVIRHERFTTAVIEAMSHRQRGWKRYFTT